MSNKTLSPCGNNNRSVAEVSLEVAYGELQNQVSAEPLKFFVPTFLLNFSKISTSYLLK